jgi:hypothetical protein
MTIDEIAAVASTFLSTDDKTFGAVNALAEVAGVHHSTVCGWKRAGLVPVPRARIIGETLGIPLHMIRPDVWTPPPPRRSRSRHRELIPAE